MVVMVVIRNSKGEFLMQKRVESKGGDWGVTGGHPKSGETPIEGIITEVKEVINEVKDVQQSFSESCLSCCIRAHQNNRFLVSEIGASIQKFIIYYGIHDFFGIGKVHMEIVETINVIQFYI